MNHQAMHIRRKLKLIAVSLGLASVLAGSVALAQSVHLKGGRRAEPAFTDNGLTLSTTGELAGLGNGDVLITLSATGNPQSTCTNPAGANQPPGQNPAEVVLMGTQSIPAAEIENGNVNFDVTTRAPMSPIPNAPGCPNPRWTQAITDVAFTSAMIVVVQGGATVLTVQCSFSSPTANGPVPANQVTCTSS